MSELTPKLRARLGQIVDRHDELGRAMSDPSVTGDRDRLRAVGQEYAQLEAICVVCGESATRTQRIVNGVPADYDDPIIVIGAQEAYEARCRTCHTVPRRVTA